MTTRLSHDGETTALLAIDRYKEFISEGRTATADPPAILDAAHGQASIR